jgi:predicted transcriptional regulator
LTIHVGVVMALTLHRLAAKVKAMTTHVKKLTVHGQWLSLLRHELQLPFRELAEMIEVSPSMLSRYSQGLREPRPRVWRAIAALAQVSDSDYWAGPPMREVAQ